MVEMTSLNRKRKREEEEHGDGPAEAPPAKRARVSPAADNQSAVASAVITREKAYEYMRKVEETYNANNDMHTFQKFKALMQDFAAGRVGREETLVRMAELLRGYPRIIQDYNVYLSEDHQITLPEEGLRRDRRQQAIIFKRKVEALDPEMYREFRRILSISKYRSKTRGKSINDVDIYKMAARLFKDRSDLLQDFRTFLPDTLNIPGGTSQILAVEPDRQPAQAHRSRRVASDSKRLSRTESEEKVPNGSTQHSARRLEKEKEGKKKMDLENSKGNMGNQKKINNKEEGDHVKAHDGHTKRVLEQDAYRISIGLRALKDSGRGVESPRLARKSIGSRTQTKLTNEGDVDLGKRQANPLDVSHRTKINKEEKGTIEHRSLKNLKLWNKEDGSDYKQQHGTPSYQRLLKNDYRRVVSQHRTELGKSVLNDDWALKEYENKYTRVMNKYEECLLECEDEKFEFDVDLETKEMTAKKAAKYLSMLQDENGNIEALLPPLEVFFSVVNRRCIEKLYGGKRIKFMELVSENPSQALLQILNRLVEVVEEGMRLREEKNMKWSMVYKANFHLSLNPKGSGKDQLQPHGEHKSEGPAT